MLVQTQSRTLHILLSLSTEQVLLIGAGVVSVAGLVTLMFALPQALPDLSYLVTEREEMSFIFSSRKPKSPETFFSWLGMIGVVVILPALMSWLWSASNKILPAFFVPWLCFCWFGEVHLAWIVSKSGGFSSARMKMTRDTIWNILRLLLVMIGVSLLTTVLLFRGLVPGEVCAVPMNQQTHTAAPAAEDTSVQVCGRAGVGSPFDHFWSCVKPELTKTPLLTEAVKPELPETPPPTEAAHLAKEL